MSKVHYCSRCGLSMTPAGCKSNLHWMQEHGITMCNECNPKLWEEAESKDVAHHRIRRELSDSELPLVKRKTTIDTGTELR